VKRSNLDLGSADVKKSAKCHNAIGTAKRAMAETLPREFQ